MRMGYPGHREGRTVGWGKRSWGELARRGSKSAGDRPAHTETTPRGRAGERGGTAEAFEAEHSFAVMGAREAQKVGEQRRHSGVRVSEAIGS